MIIKNCIWCEFRKKKNRRNIRHISVRICERVHGGAFGGSPFFLLVQGYVSFGISRMIFINILGGVFES